MLTEYNPPPPSKTYLTKYHHTSVCVRVCVWGGGYNTQYYTLTIITINSFFQIYRFIT